MNKKILFIFCFISCLMICPCSASQGLGVSPSSFEYPIATKLVTYENTFTVANTGDETEYFTYLLENPGSEWITLYMDGEVLETPFEIESHSSIVVNSKLTIPQDASNGDYEAKIIFKTSEDTEINSENEGVATGKPIIKIPLTYYITVTGDQILQGEVLDLKLSRIEEKSPLKAISKFKNTGNVQATLTMDGIIYQGENKIAEVKGTSDFIKPGCEEEVLIVAPADLPEGNYQAEITISLEENVLKEQTMSFQVLPEGSLAKEIVLKELKTEGEPELNSMVKVIAVCENTGNADVSAKLNAEIYADGKLKELVVSEDSFIPVGQTKDIILYYTPTDKATYEIKGKILYSGMETGEKTLVMPLGTAAPGFMLIAAICSLLIAARRKK